MKQITSILVILFLSPVFTEAQSVTNIRCEQRDKKVIIFYDLTSKQGSNWKIDLYYSQDGGKSWSTPLQKISGETGNKIKPGTDKVITWDVLSEVEKLEGKICFKISAIEQLPYPLEYYKFKKSKQDWLIAGLVSSATGVFGYLQYDKYYKQYKTSTDEAADLHKKVDLYNTVSSAVMVAGFCTVEFIRKARSQSKAKKQSLRIYPQPIDNGTGIGLVYTF